MSRTINSFAVLDDSDYEQVVPTTSTTSTKKKENKSSNDKKNNVSKSNGNNKSRRNPNNDRNTKSGRGPRQARDGKRTYDRRSGTGRGREIKKGGGGARNWGSDKNDAKKAEGYLAEEGENTNTAVDDQANGEDGDKQQSDAPILKEEEEEVEVQEEDKTVTLEEYLSSKKKVTLFEKGEKELDNEFEGKNARVYVEENFLVMGSGKALRKKGGKKEVEKLEIDFQFKNGGSGGGRGRGDDRGGRRGRDGGGRGRGERRYNDRRGGDRRGRGGGRRGGRGSSFAFDTNAFPSL